MGEGACRQEEEPNRKQNSSQEDAIFCEHDVLLWLVAEVVYLSGKKKEGFDQDQL
jgi:hypothetical protein